MFGEVQFKLLAKIL